jgi:hypothetical protein
MKACRYAGPSRIRYRVIDITLVPTYEPRYRPVQQEENKRVQLAYNEVCIALPIIRKRRRIMITFMDPHRLMTWRWSSTPAERLSPEERACLDGNLELYDEATTAVAVTVCEFRGLLYHGKPTPIGLRLRALYGINHKAINGLPPSVSKFEALS